LKEYRLTIFELFSINSQIENMNKTQHYVLGKWTSATGEGKASYDAVSGEFIAETSVEGLDIPAILHYGRTKGGEKLRKMTFQERGNMIKSLALYLTKRKEAF
jgi:oxepin-CoA hydrolase/3-oxo-5,6-dehydrosuberyl-CoA semialdehyde dehydrogenase